MAHQIPLSIAVVSLVVAIALSRSPRPAKAVRILYVGIAVLAFVWCMLCLRVYPVEVPVEWN
jgi:hypothetical protein